MAKEPGIELRRGDTEKDIMDRLKKLFKASRVTYKDSEIRKMARQILKDHFDKDGNPKSK